MRLLWARPVALVLTGCALALTAISGVSVARQPAAAGSFYVVTFTEKITEEFRRDLVDAGFEIVAYEPTNSYIAWADPEAVVAARRLPSVASVASLPLVRKLGPGFTDVGGRSPSVKFVTHPSALHRTVDEISRAGDVLWAGAREARLSAVVARVPADRVPALVAAPWILNASSAETHPVLEDEMGTLTVAGGIDEGRPSGEYESWLTEHRVTGRGVTVAVVDTGIWDRHPDLEGRVIDTFNYGIPDGVAYDSQSHGTHVAGIVGGSPARSGPGFDDPDGFAYGQGVAPEVLLVNQNMAPLLASPAGAGWFERLAGDAWRSGARIFNGSWSTSEGHRLGYVDDARRLDVLARNALVDTRAMEELLFVFSAGNEGDEGPPTPHEAKNIITVGATHGGRGLHYPLQSDVDEPAPFSARGPTVDSRIFPTVTAPGVWVPSARPPAHMSPACIGPADGLALYCSKSGTSMAAPHVSGAAALIHQWWKRERGKLPSPAMVKALLVNSATDTQEADIPNDTEGWGRVNLGTLFSSRMLASDDQRTTFKGPGARKSYTVQVDRAAPLKVSLAWSDAPAAAGASPALVNDLDLVVQRLRGGEVLQTWRGNNFSRGWSTPGGTPDRLNNLENVFIRRPQRGSYRITIEAFNVPGDGVPGDASRADQDYALVAASLPERIPVPTVLRTARNRQIDPR